MKSTHAPRDAKDLFGDLPGWWIAGGWAIDLWLGRQTREHVDLDIATLRKNQRIFWRRLEAWDLQLGTAPGVVEPWSKRGVVPPPSHAVWCRQTPTSPWAFEILLNDSNETDWLFRRDHSVRLPLAILGHATSDGIPYLTPEVVLLYKAKNVRENDQKDFESALPALSPEQRAWLRESLNTVHANHAWSTRLA
jgi:hypothetical protein